MYAAWRRAWTTDHTSCNETQMGPCLLPSFCFCALSDGEGFTAMNYVTIVTQLEERNIQNTVR